MLRRNVVAPSSWTTVPRTVPPSLPESLGATVVREELGDSGEPPYGWAAGGNGGIRGFLRPRRFTGSGTVPARPPSRPRHGRQRGILVLGNWPAAARSWPLHARIANIVLASPDPTPDPATGDGTLDRCGQHAARTCSPWHGGPAQRLPPGNVSRGEPSQLADRGAPRPVAPRTGKSKLTGTIRGTITAVRDILPSSVRPKRRCRRDRPG